jgi:hypothetical protein
VQKVEERPVKRLDVQLSEIRDLGWSTEKKRVESFRSSLRGGQVFTIRVALIYHKDGETWHYEIIDGLHRYEATKLEGRETIWCEITEYQEDEYETVRLMRIQACHGHIDGVLNERVIRDLREWFIKDIAGIIKGDNAELLEPFYGEDGTLHAKKCQSPLAYDNPQQALLDIDDHIFSLTLLHKSAQKWAGKVQVRLNEVAVRLGKSSDELYAVIGISNLTRNGVTGKVTSRTASLIHGVRDDDLRQLIERRRASEKSLSDTKLEYALDWLGCGPNVDTTSICRRHPKSEMVAAIQKNTLSQLFNQYVEAQRAQQEAMKPKPVAPPKKEEEPFNPFFDGTPASILQYPARVIPPTPNRIAPVTQDSMNFHNLVLALQVEIKRLAATHGDSWRTWPVIQGDLQVLRAIVDDEGEAKVI